MFVLVWQMVCKNDTIKRFWLRLYGNAVECETRLVFFFNKNIMIFFKFSQVEKNRGNGFIIFSNR